MITADKAYLLARNNYKELNNVCEDIFEEYINPAIEAGKTSVSFINKYSYANKHALIFIINEFINNGYEVDYNETENTLNISWSNY